jgi:hypothetical protein
MSSERVPLSPGTRLLHVGPYKTGTTALQGAFHSARTELAAHGALYAWKGRQAKEPAVAVTGADPPGAPWQALCEEVAGAGGRRVMISSEFFSNADARAARAVVKGLTGGDVHVVVTLRPLLKILPSHWQQDVKHGRCHSYEDWLTGLLRLSPDEECPTPEFWHRHRHDVLLERWADAVGRDNLTVVVVDDAEPERLFRTFEGLLDLPEGLLVPEDDGANRSLTLSQAELLLQLNRRLAERPWKAYPRRTMVRQEVVPHMQAYRPQPGEPRITTPAWAEEAAAAVAEEMVARIAKLGVRIIGDLAALTPPPAGPAHTSGTAAPEFIPTAAAVEAVLGGIAAGSAATRSRQARLSSATEDSSIRKVATKDLLRVVGRRGFRRLRRTFED